MTTITVQNPWTGETFDFDISTVTDAQMEHAAELMHDDIREALHDKLAPCSNAEFLAAYAAQVDDPEHMFGLLCS
jgi:hypothetical protein